MQFLYQPLTWAFFLVLAPLLIHLINLMRQRRVQWAAMEFLLKSQKKHRRWIWLRQLLLLLLRMLAIAAIVAMLARLVTRDQWSSFFSSQATHHYVLLDDSFSMTDRTGSVEAFDLALQSISEICKQASKQGTVQKLTLIRYSQAGKAADTQQQAASIADLNDQVITDSLLQLLEERNKLLTVSDLAIGPDAALDLAERLMRQATDEKRIVHLVSDFRDETWDQPVELAATLERLSTNQVDLRFVRCAKQQQDNIALVDLRPASGTQSAGVPMLVDVKVKNFGARPAANVQVKVRTEFHPTSPDGSELAATEEQLPNVVIENVQPGETVTRTVEVYFATSGRHIVHASLVPDAVEADNDRWCVVDLPEGVPTLLVDDTADQRGAYFLESVFQPGKRTQTGIRPATQPATFLRDISTDELQQFEVVYLLRPDKLSAQATENLNAYVNGGGGLAIFLGPEVDLNFFNDWYAEGSGLFPVELTGIDELPQSPDGAPDVLFADHPIFSVLHGQRNPFARNLRVSQHVKPKATWRPAAESSVRVVASLRDGSPLVIEKHAGAGRLLLFLTTADTEWNNWAREPSFVVMMLQLHGYLSSTADAFVERLTGSPIEFQLDSATHASEVKLTTPLKSGEVQGSIAQTATIVPDSPVLSFSFGKAKDGTTRTGETDSRGVYEAATITIDGTPSFRRFALNVDNRDSDLAVSDNAKLANRLEGVEFSVFEADEIVYGSLADAGTPWSDVLLAILVPLLLLEQLMAYFTSYHPKVPAAGGVA
ncbi:MAG: BatA domain-containing protein [Planctomycetales bacterium]|nr:BatA domain-containing protein [Planctomycetales bacterium]